MVASRRKMETSGLDGVHSSLTSFSATVDCPLIFGYGLSSLIVFVSKSSRVPLIFEMHWTSQLSCCKGKKGCNARPFFSLSITVIVSHSLIFLFHQMIGKYVGESPMVEPHKQVALRLICSLSLWRCVSVCLHVCRRVCMKRREQRRPKRRTEPPMIL